MFSQPSLSQSEQPKAHYDYDGLSGGWLWFPWWVHLIVAGLAWPLSWWVFSLLPFQNPKISAFLWDYRLQIASSISILTVITAILSYVKALKIQRRDLKLKSSKTVKKEVAKPKTVKAKNNTNKTENTVAVAKKVPVKKKETKTAGAKTTTIKKKRAPSKKKGQEQLELFK